MPFAKSVKLAYYYVFSTAELHRWHRSDSGVEANRNCGQTLLLWDLLLGTYYNPRDCEVKQVGLDGMANFPRSFGAQLLTPFKPYSIFEQTQEPEPKKLVYTGDARLVGFATLPALL